MPYAIAGSVLALVQLPMSQRQQAAVARLDAEDFSGVVRLARKELGKQGIEVDEEYCERAILAVKQYYALTIFDPRNMHAISDVLDPFWHAHILDTVRYKLLCEGIGAFMHHDPLDMHDAEKVAAVGRVYDYTYQMLVRIFGENNLDAEFHPQELVEASLVCRHDIEDLTDGEIFGDVFPEDLQLAPLKKRYGFRAQEAGVRALLAA